MAKELQKIDISNVPELLRLAEEVQASRAPRLLTSGEHEVAILSPVAPTDRPRPRGRRRVVPIPRTDSLFSIVGLGSSEGATDVSANPDTYLAQVYYEEFHPPKEP